MAKKMSGAMEAVSKMATGRDQEERNRKMPTLDLTTTYLGLQLKNPLVASGLATFEESRSARRLEDLGSLALVMYSLLRRRSLKRTTK
jgi:hypothetical protein